MPSDTTSFSVACLQVCAGSDLGQNIESAVGMIGDAINDGADFVLMPENVTMMEWGRKAITSKAQTESDHQGLAAFRIAAKQHGIWLHCGSLAVSLDDGRVANRTYVLDSDGEIAARYDKIHMFDVDLGNGERYAESSTFAPGDKAVLIDLPWGKLGLTICYDLRFPSLFRDLAQAGAEMITVPSAFTQVTGEAHWHVLLRSRAIETGAFIFAPAQTGIHPGDRKTYGHALIVDPWGTVLADAGTEPGIIGSTVDVADVGRIRQKMPSLGHDRPFARVSD
ncbi:MAG: carbon-nitrogen hydrolase family protein [Alphaproteobacteria bacterium]|nr:carbon-nitrogen hydrolase family protein [Alphaproteobacteria bacterium]